MRDIPPKYLDCGDLLDAETGEELRPATAKEASRSIQAQRHEGSFRGVIHATVGDDDVLAIVRAPPDMSLEDWRLAVALKIKAERRLFGRRGKFN